MSEQGNGESARDALCARVVAPAFFQRLGELGISPANEKQAASLLEIGYNTYAASIINEVHDSRETDQALAKLAAESGGGQYVPDDVDIARHADAWTKEAFDILSQDPAVVEAARAYVSNNS